MDLSWLTPEQKLERKRAMNRLRQQNYRIRHKDERLGRPSGRPKKGETCQTEVRDGVIIHTIKEPAKEEWRPLPKITLNKNSKLEDLLPWAMEVAEELRQCPVPAAWASALTSVLKIIEFLDKKLPPTMPDVKPRPRQTIVIEDTHKEEEE